MMVLRTNSVPDVERVTQGNHTDSLLLPDTISLFFPVDPLNLQTATWDSPGCHGPALQWE